MHDACDAVDGTIPRKIHYIWIGPKTLPRRTQSFIDGWRRLHPDFEIVEWNEDKIDFSFRFVQVAYTMQAWNRISDFTRMWALLSQGGIYLDTDVELRRPLHGLLGNTCFMGFQRQERHSDWVNGAVMGAVQGHWFAERVHRYFVEKMHGWEAVGSFYGPGLITKLLVEEGLREYSEQPQRVRDVTLYPTRWFYPYGWTEAFSEESVTPDTVAIHHWDETWKRQYNFTQRLGRLALRLSAQASPGTSCRATRAYVRRVRRLA